jgi:hypothetical protein
MKHHSLTQLRRGVAVAAAFATLAAPSALAGTNTNVPDDPWFNYAKSFTYAKSQAAANAFVTDTLAPGGGSSQIEGYRFTTDTLAQPVANSLDLAGLTEARGYTAISKALVENSRAATPVVLPLPTDGFHWSDAGIGAGSMLGLMLILLAATRLLLQRRRSLAL